MMDQESKAGFAASRNFFRGPGGGSGGKLVLAAVCAGGGYIGLQALGTSSAVYFVGSGCAVYLALCVYNNGKLAREDKDKGRQRSDATSGVDGALAGDATLQKMAGTKGVVIGATGPEPDAPLLKVYVQSNMATIAPPGFGKGALLLATLLVPEGVTDCPVFVIDPQLENYMVCALRRRQLGRTVVLLDPFGVVADFAAEYPYLEPIARSSCFNPLDLISPGDENAIDIVDQLVGAIYPDTNKGGGGGDGAGEYFKKKARAIFRAATLWVAATETGERRSLPYVYDLINKTERDDLVALWSARPDVADGIPASEANSIRDLKVEQYGSIKDSMQIELPWLIAPQMRRHLMRSDFDVFDLAENRLDVFGGVSPDKAETYASWFRMLTIVPSLVLTKRRRPKRPVLAIVDEFQNLGNNAAMTRHMRTGRKIGLRFWLLIQDMPGLIAAYGENEAKSIINVCEYVGYLGFGRSDLSTAETACKLIGPAHFLKKSKNTGTGNSARADEFLGQNSRQDGETVSYEKDDVRAAHVLLNQPAGTSLNFISFKEGDRFPVECSTVAYYNRPEIVRYATDNPYPRFEE